MESPICRCVTAVISDFEMVRKSTRGYDPFDVLRDEPNFIVRAGGVEAAAAYLDRARDRNNTGGDGQLASL